MKTREQIYGQEAAGILRDVSMYRALTERQLLKLYPHKESKIRNLLSYLQKQGRIVQRGEYYRLLQLSMGLPAEEAHIAKFSAARCDEVIALSRRFRAAAARAA